MASAWSPSLEAVEQLLRMIRDCTSADNRMHRQVLQQLSSFNTHPDYCNYLAYVMATMLSETDDVRQLAGLLLKNNVRDFFVGWPPETKAYVKAALLHSIGDSCRMIRVTVGTVITTIVTVGGLGEWPELLPSLIERVDSQHAESQEGAFDALFKICEDSAEFLGECISILAPKFLQHCQDPSEAIRKYALGSLNQLLRAQVAEFRPFLPNYLQMIILLSTDPTPLVRKRVCSGLVMMVELHAEALFPHIASVVEYMLHASKDKDEDVALEACEFWTSICEGDTSKKKEFLRPVLPRLCRLLLENMVYTDYDLIMMGGADEEDDVPDRAEDIRPVHYHSSTHTPQHQAGGQELEFHQESGATGDDDDDDDGVDDDDDVSEWNIRKCSAAGLDTLSTVFPDELLPIVLPIIQEKLNSPTWEVRESVVLGIGAIAEGCSRGMAPYLHQLLPYLLSLLKDRQPLIRSITCWTISRYSRWIVTVDEDHSKFFRPVLEGLLQRVLDNNKRVQEAACSAFATLEEEAQAELVPYLQPILQNLTFAFGKYQARNLIILYDALGTLADAVDSNLNQPALIQILMPPLTEKWNNLTDNDVNLFPLLECLTSVAQALGQGFTPFAPPVYQRCLKFIENTLSTWAAYDAERDPTRKSNMEDQLPDKEFIVCALDLLSGLCEGLGPSMEALVAESPLLELLRLCMQDQQSDVRQSAYSLVGDLAKACFGHIRPHLPNYFPILIHNLNPAFVSVCNNSTWAIGEIAMRLGAEMQPYVQQCLPVLIAIMNRGHLNKSLLENTAITIGRFGLVCPGDVAPHLQHFIRAWCMSLRNIRDDLEKEQAFQGLCKMIHLNPNGVVHDFVYLCDGIASWRRPPSELKQMFHQIIHGFISAQGANWAPFLQQFPECLRRVLHEQYGV